MKPQNHYASKTINMRNPRFIAGLVFSCHAFSRRLALVFVPLIVVAVVSTFSSLAIAQSATIFVDPPTTDELAAVLFPPKTRSIVINAEVNSNGNSSAATGIAGMLIQFKYGKTDIVPASLPFLDAVGRMLTEAEYSNESIIIEGHTDSVGSLVFNQKLSEKRALAVRRYLVSRFNIDIARLHPVGKGETALHDAANPTAGINRRVQFRSLERVQ